MTNFANIFILTGAGISAESGLATFRSQNGLWNNHKVEDVASIEGFQRNPKYVRAFYNELKPEVQKAEPNAAHLALAQLEHKWQGEVNIITQNVDTLHEKAGSQNVWHIHGRIDEALCLTCGHILKTWENVDSNTICPHCQTKGNFKPNIVFFGENLQCMETVAHLLSKAHIFISIGTSGVVYPAAGFVQTAKYYGAETLEFNLETTSNNYFFDKHITGKCSQTLPAFVDDLLKKK